MAIELMEHQQQALDLMENGRILYGGVGSGKSLTALAYYMKAEAPRDVYVITTAKKRDSLDWLGEAAYFGIGESEDASVAGLITIDSWNNIHKYLEVEDAFFIFDEQRLVGHGSWVKNFLKIAKKNRWILLSATPGDVWLDYAPVFIANGWYKNLTDFKRQHVVYAPYIRFPKILHYLGEQRLEKLRNRILVEMPYVNDTERVINYIDVGYDKDLWDTAVKKRWNVFECRPIKDVNELFRVMRKITNSDLSRLRMITELMKCHPKLIVFYNFNYELDILRELSAFAEVAEWNGHRKQPVPKSDNWVYLVQYNSGAEGWNCTETNAMVLYSLTYSYKNHIQSLGRIDRLDSPFRILYYYVLNSGSPIDRAVRKALEGKRSFNERKWMKSGSYPPF